MSPVMMRSNPLSATYLPPFAAAIISKNTPSVLTVKFKLVVVAPPSDMKRRLSFDSTATRSNLWSCVSSSNQAYCAKLAGPN